MAKISSDALEFILEAARGLYPREFTAHLRQDGGVITEVIVYPGSTYGEGFARYRLDLMPIDRSIIGTVHSHPNGNYKPSSQDLLSFSKHGEIHMIVRHPYGGIDDVAVYDKKGEELELDVV